MFKYLPHYTMEIAAYMIEAI